MSILLTNSLLLKRMPISAAIYTGYSPCISLLRNEVCLPKETIGPLIGQTLPELQAVKNAGKMTVEIGYALGRTYALWNVYRRTELKSIDVKTCNLLILKYLVFNRTGENQQRGTGISGVWPNCCTNSWRGAFSNLSHMDGTDA